MHGNLEPEENVFKEEQKEEEIKWDIEDLKDPIRKSAEEQWDKYSGG